ncbi:MAG: hypothetical protein WAV07_15335 [Candidatus Contendobacter sp.]
MANSSYRDTALRYCVDDLPGASLPGARLQNILDYLRLGRPVTPLSLAFLQQQGLVALYHLATGVLPYDRFREPALAEQSVRVEAATAARLAREAEAPRAREAEARAREAAMWERMELARLARESDPKYIAKIKEQKLRTQYGIDTYVLAFAHIWTRFIKLPPTSGRKPATWKASGPTWRLILPKRLTHTKSYASKWGKHSNFRPFFGLKWGDNSIFGLKI